MYNLEIWQIREFWLKRCDKDDSFLAKLQRETQECTSQLLDDKDGPDENMSRFAKKPPKR